MAIREAVTDLDIKNVALFKEGKVRKVYDLGEELLFVVTDRISAFDVVMPNGIPDKGKVLNLISAFWFGVTGGLVENHMVTVDIDLIVEKYPDLAPAKNILSGRAMLVRKTKPLSVECIVRGYISGSGWKDYQSTGRVSGIPLPAGLKLSERLPAPIFTPSTKAETGHDENITQDEARKLLGKKVYSFIEEKSIALYEKARNIADEKGIIIADTKFEFGMINDKIILIDEALTPDSSRFWPKDDYESGRQQKSFDKQFVRDYLETLDWDKTPPGPVLPDDIVEKTREKYLQAFSTLTGKDLVV